MSCDKIFSACDKVDMPGVTTFRTFNHTVCYDDPIGQLKLVKFGLNSNDTHAVSSK